MSGGPNWFGPISFLMHLLWGDHLMNRLTRTCGWLFLTTAIISLGSAGTASANYVTGLWNTNSVGFLDNNLVQYGGFALVGQTVPNGIATDGTTIWVGSFLEQTVTRYDFLGNVLGSFTDPSFSNLQGMELVINELAVASFAGPGTISFYDPITGAFIRSIGDPGVGNIEGITFDGTNLYTRGTPIAAVNPATGGVNYTIPNPGTSLPYEGTGLAAIGGNQLVLAGSDGSWIKFSSVDGSVIDSGNNGLSMGALKYFNDGPQPVPEPSSLVIFGLLGMAFCGARMRRPAGVAKN